MTSLPPSGDITRYLVRCQQGDPGAWQQVMEQLYPLLRRMAQVQVNHERDLTIAPTELVHEAFLKLSRQNRLNWKSRSHFLAIAGKVLRQVIADYVKWRSRQKRGGDTKTVAINMDTLFSAPLDADHWLVLEAALGQLQAVDAAAVRIVEQRFFAGMTVEEIAALEGKSDATIKRKWRFAKAFIKSHLG